MKEITAYETSDGEVFKTKADAEQHEEDYLYIDNIRNFVSKYWEDVDTHDDLVDMMINRRNELTSLFKGPLDA